METKLNPPDLLQALQGVEKAMGRIRDRKWEPRLIDLDLLSYDELVSEEGALRLPHPEIQNRFFVLIPLTEIAPDWIHPKLGQTAQALLEQLTAIQRPEGIKKIPSTLA